MGPTRLPSCEGIHPSAGPLSPPLAFSSRALVSESPLEDRRPTRLDESFAKPQAPSKEPDKPFGGGTISHRGRNWRGLIGRVSDCRFVARMLVTATRLCGDRWLWRRNWKVVHPGEKPSQECLSSVKWRPAANVGLGGCGPPQPIRKSRPPERAAFLLPAPSRQGAARPIIS